jgi:hypothetical protein
MGLGSGIVAAGAQPAGQFEDPGVEAADAPVPPLRIMQKQRVALRDRAKGVAKVGALGSVLTGRRRITTNPAGCRHRGPIKFHEQNVGSAPRRFYPIFASTAFQAPRSPPRCSSRTHRRRIYNWRRPVARAVRVVGRRCCLAVRRRLAYSPHDRTLRTR